MPNDLPRVHWDGRKWPNHRHWQFEMRRLGDDEHGTWFHVPAGTVAQRGDDPPIVLEHAFVSLVPAAPDAWWQAEFYADHPTLEVYVNIGTPCELLPGRVRQVDLDLDVVRELTGDVEVIDEDEFAAHQVRYAYPPELVAAATDSASAVTQLLRARTEPFESAHRSWMAATGMTAP